VNNKTMCSFMSNDKLDALIEELKAKAQGGAV
jgi:NADH-quinone oxidoreductase subunit E